MNKKEQNSCCKVSSTHLEVPECPSCHKKGKSVKLITLKSLLKEDAASRLNDKEQYFYCDSPTCDVVDYAKENDVTFRKQDLEVRVGIKEISSPRPICYCFNHTIESIQEEIQHTGKSTVIDSIKKNIQAGLCSCETTNPQGSCCLGNITKVVKDGFSMFNKDRILSQ